MYAKRQTIKKFWAVPKKGTKYVAISTHEKSKAMPLITVIRDVMTLVKTKKELKKLINDKKILVNSKIIKEVNYPVLLFDNISFPLIKKHYRAILKGKRFGLEEINEEKAKSRVYKVINKKQLKGKKTQINLSSGKNILSDKIKDIKVGDFVVLSNEDNKIIKTISLQKGLKVVVVSGKHIGQEGKIKDIKEEAELEIAEIISKEGEIKVDTENLFVVE